MVVAFGAMGALVFGKRASHTERIVVTLRNVNGAAVGTVTLTARSPSAPVDVRASVRRMKPGFHGFHIHAVGKCEGPTFMSATGHLKTDAQSHGDHAGDMSSLAVKGNGTATLRFTTDRFDLSELRDADGSAVMVHADADNFGNIPSRYAPNGPDQQTRDTGDSGNRLACGAIAGR
jgi:Cu-Zn family superoxide dismutase